ncbi:hypothetical protein TIFTF001_021947 [Ficus carica]|uniref:Uncharacterized protein n=1 Tax=Ficus carica TaxID=3494 RepID=A0AA88AHQ6_FICCA|nr:hypothetical protein TIFTF001_021947 [Ficus carica]
MPSTVSWQFATIPKEEQPLPTVPHREDHVLRLKKLLDQDDALRKLKGKQKTESVEGALAQLYSEFCGEENQIIEQARSEYFKMKCCSIHKKALEVHFQKMS